LFLTSSTRASVQFFDNGFSSHLRYSGKFSDLDIPLHTAVVGHGGPQIRSTDNGYFLPQGKQPLQIGLCLSIYGIKAIQYLREFVQHHKNIGIEQIVVGVEATMDSDDLNRTAAVLRPYIDEGFVVLQATGLKTFFTCKLSEVQKLHFYHQCLYHFKGLSKYAGIWDLDEYWLPPDRSKISADKLAVTHEHVGFSGSFFNSSTSINSGTVDEQAFNNFIMSKPSLLPGHMTKDPLWQRSNYSVAFSIQDIMKAIEIFYDGNGCGQRWCFHLFPSYTVHTKREGVARTGHIEDDFDKREKNSTSTWQKSVVQTRYAMMGGYHLVGSCHYHDDTEFYPFASEPECLPHRWDSGEVGSLHHFLSLMNYREDPFLESDVIEDEYLAMYAQTVSMQLDRNDGKIADNHRN
jgi:Glycosyltransferase family 92